MRLISVLLLTVALATSAAGCFGKDDEPTDTTPTTPTGATPTSPTGATPTTPTNATGGNTTTTPAKPAPKVIFGPQNIAFTPSPGAPSNPADPSSAFPPQDFPVTVPAGYTKLLLNVTWANSQPVGVSSGVSITLLDPTGAAVGSACSVGAGPVQGVPAPCTAEGAALPAGGAYILRATGGSSITASAEVVAS